MIAVERLDVDARLRHPPRQLPQLPGHRLLQPLNDNVAHRQHYDACALKRVASCGAIREQNVSRSTPAHDPSPSALDADASTTQRLAHLGKCAGTVLQKYRNVLHVLRLFHHRQTTRDRLMVAKLSSPCAQRRRPCTPVPACAKIRSPNYKESA